MPTATIHASDAMVLRPVAPEPWTLFAEQLEDVAAIRVVAFLAPRSKRYTAYSSSLESLKTPAGYHYSCDDIRPMPWSEFCSELALIIESAARNSLTQTGATPKQVFAELQLLDVAGEVIASQVTKLRIDQDDPQQVVVQTVEASRVDSASEVMLSVAEACKSIMAQCAESMATTNAVLLSMHQANTSTIQDLSSRNTELAVRLAAEAATNAAADDSDRVVSVWETESGEEIAKSIPGILSTCAGLIVEAAEKEGSDAAA